MGTDVPDVSGRNEHTSIQSPCPDGQTAHLSYRPERADPEPLSAYRKTDGRCRGCDRGLEAMLAVGLDQGHKQHCQPRRGNYQE